ncbi:sugar ABC transporter permease protein [Butyrivibrio proteoclasticus B316]|uniref:Sugar ABC transporter permease protein n=1 Tax=Butyrivibrio proteoclasticus (strain ATCC 51982 / DSM 14932 / B316) TaxID=515622 RepID=E0RV55_BUTPB|nr:ABC transporter permease subunit [Butyrivibrio proteoclasticus]ADL34325.1 sugar ABC transporter permease protein [Butyrivibrio proteoclasticus B316]
MSKKQNVTTTSTGAPINQKPLGTRIWNNRGYYLMFLPVLVFVIIIYYWPMLGVRYAFYQYKLKNITWVGLKNFETMFGKKEFWTAFTNTLQISITKLLITTFTSVVVSVFLNEMHNMFAKKSLQTIIYLPHFMSWAVVAAIFQLFLSTSSTGFVNETLKSIGLITKSIDFLHSKALWRPIFYLINIWKETGWGTVIFLATLSGINPELYEAADIDGASRLQKIWYVTVPALMNTVIIVLILNLAKVLNLFESVFVLYNNRVFDVSDVISTYVYRQTFLTAIPDYGYTTAVGLFKSIVGCVLVLVCNWASKRIRGRGII